MTSIIKKLTLGAVLGATVLTAAAPADAQRYRHYRHRDNTGAAVFANGGGGASGNGQDPSQDGAPGTEPTGPAPAAGGPAR